MDYSVRVAVLATELLLTLVVLIWIRKSERRHALPWSFLAELLLWGGVTAILAAYIELRYALTPSQLLHRSSWTAETALGLNALQAFVPSLVEELAKYMAGVFAVLTTRHAHRFSDTVIYFILIGLGFSLVEDIFFLLNPETVAPLRLLSFYVHAGTGAILGFGFARFKFGYTGYGPLLGSLAVAVLLHGLYNLAVRPSYVLEAFPLALGLTALISVQIVVLFKKALHEDKKEPVRNHRLHHRDRSTILSG